MSEIRLLRQADLSGTAYFEFGTSIDHWDPDSVFLSIDDFDKLEPLFREYLKDFDYTGPNRIRSQDWDHLLPELAQQSPPLADWVRSKLVDHSTIYLYGL
jgi:hypothetical protein